MKIAIIGGGVSGLALASQINGDVYLFEKNSDVGKKLLLTGNGKCNYWNQDQDIKHYHSYNKELLSNYINEGNLNNVFCWTKKIGIVPKIKNGYYYPYSGNANSIKSLLKNNCINKGVTFINKEINDIEYQNNKYIVNNEAYDKVVIATGSLAYPKTGSTGFGYEMAKKFNHSINPVNPSLVPLISNLGIEDNWAGIRCDVSVSHYENNSFKKKEDGELQLTNYGLSGICIFNLSRDIRIGLNNKQKEEVHINFVPWADDINSFICNMSKEYPKYDITQLCDGFIDYKLLMALLKYLKIDYKKTWNELSDKEQKILINSLTDFIVEIKDTKDYLSSQTCSGGVSLTELSSNLESLKQPGLYFCGEVVDVDGDCGGYNITWAFLSAYLVSRGIND